MMHVDFIQIYAIGRNNTGSVCALEEDNESQDGVMWHDEKRH